MNYATSAFYDDIRTEITQKRILIGGYTNSINASSLPLELPSLWASIQYGTSIDDIDPPAVVEISIPGEEEPRRITLNTPPPSPPDEQDDVKFLMSRIDIPLGRTNLTAEGMIAVIVISQSGERVRAGKLRVIDQSKSNEDGFLIPMNSLPLFMARFMELRNVASEEVASEFAGAAMSSLCQFMLAENSAKMLEGFNGIATVENNRALVFFPNPYDAIPLEIKINFPSEDKNYEICQLSRFGFEIVYASAQENPADFEYEVLIG